MEKIKKNWFAYLLLLLAVIQILFIAYVNLHDSKIIIDYDDANVMIHAREMWENKSLHIENWVETTTMELDCASLLAMPLYGLTNDIFTAFALANIIMVLIYAAVIFGIFANLGYLWKYGCLSVNLLLIPYSVGMVEYFQMMFYHGAQYSVKVLIPMLVIWLFTRYKKQGKLSKEIWIILLLTCILAFVSGFSSGIYVLMCGLLPILVCLLIDFVQSYDYKKYNIGYVILIGSIMLCGVAGYLVNKMQSAVDYGANMKITSREYMALNAKACILGFFDVLHALPNFKEAVPILSAEGITYIGKVAIVLFIIGVVCMNVKRIFQGNREIEFQKYLVFLFVWNLFVLIFCDSRYALANENIEYRYYLLPFIFAMLLASMQLEEGLKQVNAVYRNTIQGAVVLILAFVTIGCQRQLIERAKEGYNDATAICEAIQSLDVESVYFLCDKDMQGTARLIDSEHTYGGYDKESGKFVVYDYYLAATDRAAHKDKNALVLYINETPDMYFPSYLADSYSKAATVGWYDIWRADENKLDGRTGLPIYPYKSSTDFFFSEGYGYDAERSFINSKGELELLGTGGYIAQSPSLQSAGNLYTVTLEYDCIQSNGNDVIGTLDVISNGRVLQQAELTSDSKQALLDNVSFADGNTVVGIAIKDGVGCTLKSISYEER